MLLFIDSQIKEFLNGYDDFLLCAVNKLPQYAYDKKVISAVASRIGEMLCEIENNYITPERIIGELRRIYDRAAFPSDSSALMGFELERIEKSCDDTDNYMKLLIALSCHPNGFCRENSIKALACYPEALPYIILRMNDWVAQVRASAERTALAAAEKCSLSAAVISYDVLKSFGDKQRYSAEIYNVLCGILEKRIKAEIDEKFICYMTSRIYAEKHYTYNNRYQRRIYSVLIDNKLIDRYLAEYLYRADKHTVHKHFIFVKALKAYEYSREELIRLTGSNSVSIRLCAVRKLVSGGLWSGAERLLTDKSKAVRDEMIAAFEKYSDMDIRGYLTEKIPLPEAVSALARVYKKGDEELILPLTEHEDPKTAAAAIQFLCIICGNKYEELYYSKMFGNKKKAAWAAYKAMRHIGASIHPDELYKEILNADNDLLKGWLTDLMCRQNIYSWERIPYLLRLCRYHEKNMNYYEKSIAEKVRFTVENEQIYLRISAETAKAVYAAIEECDPPHNVAWALKQRIAAYIK